MTVQDVINKLHDDIFFSFYQDIDGTLKQFLLEDWINEYHIYSGSFNPIHNGHRFIYDSMLKNYSNKNEFGITRRHFYEISVSRVDKENLTPDILEKRLKQFVGYAPILITNAPRFVEKAGLFRTDDSKTFFHMGEDTLNRLCGDLGCLGVQGLTASIVVYPRTGHDPVPNLRRISNVTRGPNGPESIRGLSSTQIRQFIGEL